MPEVSDRADLETLVEQTILPDSDLAKHFFFTYPIVSHYTKEDSDAGGQ